MNDRPDDPKKSKGDVAHAVVKAAVGSIPLVGAAGTELFAYVVSSPYEKRQQEWMKEVGDAIAELRDHHGVDVDELRDDPAFTDTVLSVTQAALRTADKAKRAAFRNAIANSGLPSPLAASTRQTFIRLIDEFTSWHLRLLDLFADPVAWFKRNGRTPPELMMGSLSQTLETAYPELRGHRDAYDQWWKELRARGLVTTDSLHGMMSGHGSLEPRATGSGKAFLDFIREPDAK